MFKDLLCRKQRRNLTASDESVNSVIVELAEMVFLSASSDVIISSVSKTVSED